MSFTPLTPTVCGTERVSSHTAGVNLGEQTERIFRLLHMPFAEIAEQLGVGYDTVKGWSVGRADPTPENRRALADFVRAHAAELVKLAEGLERASGAASG